MIVAAAGNKQDLEEGRPPDLPKLDGYPAAYEGVIAVAAVDHWGQYYDSILGQAPIHRPRRTRGVHRRPGHAQ